MSLKTMYMDKLSKSCWDDSEFRDVLRHTKSLDEVSGEMFDCIYLAGGHGAMFDFTDNAVLQELIKNHYENNKIVGAICHGVCGLLNVKLSDGQYLVKDKKVTGFSWFEEGLAGKKRSAFRSGIALEGTAGGLQEVIDSDDTGSSGRRKSDHGPGPVQFGKDG